MDIMQTAAEVNKAISSIQNRAKKLDKDIHTVAVSCLHHADQHGDVTLMQNLILAMGKSQRRNALIGWANAFGKFQPDEKGRNVEYCRGNTTDIEGAIGISPWEFTPEQAFKPFDMQAELKKLLKRATKASEDSRNNVPKEFFTKIGEALAGDVEVKQLIEAMESAPDSTEVPYVQAEPTNEAA